MPANAPAANEAPADWTWVPIRSLGARQRDRVGSHLMALDQGDRYLRFGYPATDAQISKYVDAMDFERDEVFGIFNRHLELIAMAHLAHPVIAVVTERPPMSELGCPYCRRPAVAALDGACSNMPCFTLATGASRHCSSMR